MVSNSSLYEQGWRHRRKREWSGLSQLFIDLQTGPQVKIASEPSVVCPRKKSCSWYLKTHLASVYYVYIFASSCTFHSVGTAAGEQKFNSLCVLSLNIINEKIYLLLWFWFYILTFLTAVHIMYRVTVIVMPFSRYGTSDRPTD